MDWELIQRLMNCFTGSSINQYGEFIAHDKSNEYFILKTCKTELDIKCKVIEWFSRGAYKAEPFRSDKANKELRSFMLNGINKFLGTSFTEKDMCVIYEYLGNACNHEKTIRFIESGYDFSVFTAKVGKE